MLETLFKIVVKRYVLHNLRFLIMIMICLVSLQVSQLFQISTVQV